MAQLLAKDNLNLPILVKVLGIKIKSISTVDFNSSLLSFQPGVAHIEGGMGASRLLDLTQYLFQHTEDTEMI